MALGNEWLTREIPHLQVIYVMRNPKDVFTSSYHYYGMASYLVKPGTQDQFLQKFINGKGLVFFPIFQLLQTF